MIRLLLALLVIAAPLRADEARAPERVPGKQEPTVQTYGRAHPECAEWSDSCLVCTKAGCSTPGIACAPVETVCRR